MTNTLGSGVPTQASELGIYSIVQRSNQKNSENLYLLKEILFRLTGVQDKQSPVPCPTEEQRESIKSELSETIQQAHEIEDIARRIFEAL